MSQIPSSQKSATPSAMSTRNLYIRGVSQEVWDRIHINAIKSRLGLTNYLIQVLESAPPFAAREADG